MMGTILKIAAPIVIGIPYVCIGLIPAAIVYRILSDWHPVFQWGGSILMWFGWGPYCLILLTLVD